MTRDPHHDAQILATRAWAVLHLTMEQDYKLDVGQDQAEVLRGVLGEFAALTTGAKRGRIAFPLSPGMGKSQAILATITALYQLDLPYRVMVCAVRAAALCELLDDLEAMGVPEGEQGWGLLHSVASAPRRASENPAAARYLFQTQVRARSWKALEASTVSPASDRMIFWDESLLISDSWAISRRELFAQIDGLPERTLGNQNPDVAAAVAYLQACQSIMRQELDRQQSGTAAGLLALPDVDEGTRERYKVALATVHRAGEQISEFLDIAHAEVRAAWIGQSNGAVITYHIAVPDTMDRIAVLDASYPVRRLCLEDPSVSLSDHPALSLEALALVKSYQDTELHIVKHRSGRSGIEDALKVRGGAPLFREIAQIVKTGAPDTEEWLLVVFNDKPRQPRQQEVIMRALREAGVPNLETGRIRFVTYGQENSSNAFRNVPNCILVGVMQRSHASLYGQYLGQTMKWDATLDTRALIGLDVSESTHTVFQAIHRTRMRKMVNGKAMPTRAWIFYNDPPELLKGLRSLMPGLPEQPEWEAAALPKREEKTSGLTEQIVAFVKSLPMTVKDVKPKDVKASVCPAAPRTTFWRAFQDALPLLSDWGVVGRNRAMSLYRKKKP